MDLSLKQKLSKEELNEIKRRAFSAMEQLFLEGLSAGRELNNDNLHYETEEYVRNKILILSNYFIEDDIWRNQPPANYREKKEIPELNENTKEQIEKNCHLNTDEKMEGDFVQAPDWATKNKPFD